MDDKNRLHTTQNPKFYPKISLKCLVKKMFEIEW